MFRLEKDSGLEIKYSLAAACRIANLGFQNAVAAQRFHDWVAALFEAFPEAGGPFRLSGTL